MGPLNIETSPCIKTLQPSEVTRYVPINIISTLISWPLSMIWIYPWECKYVLLDTQCDFTWTEPE